jgi:hypothetical protein
MTEKHISLKAAQKMFETAAQFRECGKALLPHQNFRAGAAALCHQSAERMMIAFIWRKGNPDVLTAELTTAEIWDICTALREELADISNEVQVLLDCEWASYPQEAGGIKADAGFAERAMECLGTLEQSIRKAAPELAMKRI